MTTPIVLDVAAALDRFRAGLRDAPDGTLERRAAEVATLPGRVGDELRRLVDAERERRQAARPPMPPAPAAARSRVMLVAAGTAVAAGPVAVLAGRGMAGHAEVLPEQMVYAPAAALALVGAVVAGQRIARWVDERRYPLAVDVDEADLDPLGKELLARVRAQRLARGEAC